MHHTIDLHTEQVIPLKEVPHHLPKRKGKRTHYQTVYRWATKGSNGKILASVKVGGIRYTSLEALQTFLRRHNPKVRLGEYQDAIERALIQSGL